MCGEKQKDEKKKKVIKKEVCVCLKVVLTGTGNSSLVGRGTGGGNYLREKTAQHQSSMAKRFKSVMRKIKKRMMMIFTIERVAERSRDSAICLPL